MPLCEMCGKRQEILKEAIVEGTILSLCVNCTSYGEIVVLEKKKTETKLVQQAMNLDTEEKEIEVIIPDAGEQIKKARERKNLKQEDLAKLLAEKSSVISSIESSKAHLSMKLAKKLEQYFGMTLVIKHTELEPPKKIDLADSDLTIGDLIRYKGKKK